MEIFWIVVGVVIVIIYLINQNKSKTSDRTVIRQTDTYKTVTGEIRVERTKVVDSTQTTFTPPQPPITTPGNAYSNVVDQIENSRRAAPPINEKIIAHRQATTPPPIAATKQIRADEQNKQCTRCRIMLPFSKFSRSSKHPDGVTIWCTECLKGDKNTKHMKWCPMCKIRRKRTSFYPNIQNADGLMAWCKTCLDKHNSKK